MKKLELKHFAPYLPFSLECKDLTDEMNFTLDPLNIDEVSNDAKYLNTIRLYLRPLSDLTKEIEVNGENFVPYDYFYDDPENDWFDGNVWLNYMFEGNSDKTDLNFIPYYIVQKLLEWHFDVFGLIDDGLAININDL